MIKIFKGLCILAFGLATTGQQAIASEYMPNKSESRPKKQKNSNRRILVRYKDSITLNKMNASHFSAGAYVLKSFELPKNLEVVEVAKGISVEAALEYYQESDDVLYAELDAPWHAYMEPPPSEPVDPVEPPPETDEIDPRFSEQWGLDNKGQTGGTNDVDINAPEMWEQITGDKDIVIAVIDTGVNYEHPDLKNNIWTNPGEIPGNGIDDDGNGVIDDVHGFNAVAAEQDPSSATAGDPMDDHGHGSHCAGIIAAEAMNSHGGRGVMQHASIIGCKFLTAEGGGETSGAIACLEYLRNLKIREKNPVNIFATSNSWGGGVKSQALEDAIRAHQEEGILFIAAASNDNQNNDTTDVYPANYTLSNIVSVAATDHNDERAWFSNYGKRTVHLAAPGVDILSTVLGSDYEKMSGTSMATPFVSGLAGMIKTKFPSYNYVQIKNLLMTGGTPVEGLKDITISGRRIRAIDQGGFGSISCENQIVSTRLSPIENKLLLPVGSNLKLSALNINCSEPNGDVVVPMMPDDTKLTLSNKNLFGKNSLKDGIYEQDWVAQSPGVFQFLFPENDQVTVNVYDPTHMRAYVAHDENQFEYRHIQGTALEAHDDWIATIDTPFPIKFGGEDQAFSMITIGSNGAASLTNTAPIDLTNTELPNEKFMSLIAPFWDDLNPAASDGDIYFDTIGEAPNREFVIEWRNIRHYNSYDDMTFEIVFFENSSDILFNYLDVNVESSVIDKGASATIGIQTTPEHTLTLSYNDGTVIDSNKGIRFTLDSLLN
ncbi:MAG: S8 family serine peptidase [Myxococcales bacterium]|nr:MAG: S8 family serine peptidase [Myxococcales bacterium]